MVIIITYNPSSYSQHSAEYYISKYSGKSKNTIEKTRHIEDDGYVWYELYKRFSGKGIENNEGDIILYPKYAGVSYDEDSKTFLVYSDGCHYRGVLSKSGSWIISLDRQYETIYYLKSYMHYHVEKNGLEGICDEYGREIIAPNKYDDVGGPYLEDDGKRYFSIKKNGLEGICDEYGREIIAPDKYEYVGYINNSKHYFFAGSDDFVGVCDEYGREIIAPNKYKNNIRYFADRFEYKTETGKWLPVDKKDINYYSDVASVSNGSSTTVSSSNSTSSTSSKKLLYEGDYTISNQSYNTGAGQYTNAIGSGIDIHVRVYEDYIMIDGTKCNYASTSGDWRIYAGVAWNNSKEYYKVNFKNYEMSKFTDILNPFTGMFDTFTTSIVKGKVYFNVNNNSNSNNYNTGQSSTQTKSSGNVNQETTRYVDKTCHGCHNSGKCNTCNGKGWIERLGVKGTMDCPNCTNGRCSICGGSGKVRGLR